MLNWFKLQSTKAAQSKGKRRSAASWSTWRWDCRNCLTLEIVAVRAV